MRIWDMQSKFNLNAGETQAQAFEAMLASHDIPLEAALEWYDWIDEDMESREPGAEDTELLLQVPALRSANSLSVHRSELRSLPAMFDVTDEFSEFEALFVTLPSINLQLNINTVSPELLEALGFEPAVAEAITSGDREYTSLEDVDMIEAGEGTEFFVVTSNYFAVWAELRMGEQRARIESYLYRHPDDGRVYLLGRNLEAL